MRPAVASSPGRAEKLPAPGLARLLFSKSGGSRGRARSSPAFVSRSKSVRRSSALAPAPPDGIEPSSPKVTCIGQVRIRKKHKTDSNGSDLISTRRSDGCRCLRKLFSRTSKKNKKTTSGRSYSLFFCWRRKTKTTTKEKAPAAAVAFVREMKRTQSESELSSEEETKGFVVSSSAAADEAAAAAEPATKQLSPPKNALLLMRCRSAPHNRSSALSLCRFPASESEEESMIDEGGRESCNGSSKDGGDQGISWSPAAAVMRCNSVPAEKAEGLTEVSDGELNGKVREAGPTAAPPSLVSFYRK